MDGCSSGVTRGSMRGLTKLFRVKTDDAEDDVYFAALLSGRNVDGHV